MEITPEQKEQIIKEALALTLRPKNYKNYSYHMNRMGRYLGQAEIDKDALILANYNWERLIRLYVIQKVINETHAKRVAVEGKGSTPSEQFHVLLKRIKDYNKVLTIVLDYVRKRTDDHGLEITADKIKRGTTQMDIVRDVSSLTEVLKEHLELAAGITPGGKVVNEEYLNTAYAEAQEALALDGLADQSESERSQLVDLQHRLLLLSMAAIDELKEFARAAFYQDLNYYREHYSYSESSKQDSLDDDAPLDDITPEDNLSDNEETSS